VSRRRSSVRNDRYAFYVQLAVGDVVVYAAYGVGRVVARERRRVDGSDVDVVVVELSDDLTVSLPLDRARDQLRAPVSEAGLKEVQAVLRDERAVNTAPWLARQRESRAKLAEGDPVSLAEIIRDGATRQYLVTPKGSKTQLAEGERRLFGKARQLLAREIAQVQGLGTNDADEWIGRQLGHTV
jgi:RNA polymerase-interacting CarD/CdnL/TRCF family regulator